MSLFVDTSTWYAAADGGDRSNVQAKEVLSAGEPLVTTDHVFWSRPGSCCTTAFTRRRRSGSGRDCEAALP